VSSTLSRVWISIFGVTAFASTLVVRLALASVVLQLSRQGIFTRNVVIAGSAEHITRFLQRLQTKRPDFVSIIGVFAEGPPITNIGGVPVLGTLVDVEPLVRRTRIDDVVLALPWSDERRILAMLDRLRELPVNVYLGSDLVGFSLDFRDPPGHFRGLPVFPVIGHPLSDWAFAIKKVEDYSLGFLALVMALPFMGLIAAAIKLSSPGPILFKQKRLGFNNEVFEIYKFRSMRDAPASDGRTRQATKGDPRVTAVGRLLRRTSLDELPQLFNVLGGKMSLVGPRPHAVDHNEEYSPKVRGYFARHRVKPGMTGWAQVNGLRGATDSPEKMEARVRYDVFYTENWSFFFDLRILAKTLVVLFTGRNAY
jgi:Undecaprenyl-phosphate glucose phosphotransferase